MTQKTSTIHLSEKEFQQQEYIQKLKEAFTELPYKGADTFLNSPVLIDENYLENSQRLCQILNSILVMFAYNYFRDANLQSVYQLDAELNEILQMAEGIPYEIGMYRPDFIFDTEGQPKICEIGCRYPMSGWVMSRYLHKVTSELTKSVDQNWSAVEGQEEFMDEFRERFDDQDTLYLIRKDDRNHSVDYTMKELERAGIRAVDVQPEDFALVDGELKVGDEIARQFYLEMDREDLKTFDKDVLKVIIQSGRCINDVRTIILMHDKRTLSILFNQNVMSAYVNSEDHEFLSKYLIPSYIIATEQDQQTLIESEDNWVLKKSSGGKGIDMLIKNECDPEVWKHAVLKEWNTYMVQPYVEQKSFEINANGKSQSAHIAGMDLYFNGRSFGPGIFRASSGSSININNGESYVLPCVVKKDA